MKKRFDLGYHISEGFKAIFTHGFMSFAAVCMIVACLLIMGSFALVAINLDNMLGELERDNEFLAYVDDTYTEQQARALEKSIKAIPNVAEISFVTREEALENYVAGMELHKDLYEDLPDSTLRHRFHIRVTDIEQMESTVRSVEAVSGIAGISAALEVAMGFVTVRNAATAVAVVLVALLLLVSLFIISNTIRLATFYRREEIAIMKMCGATNWFIRWPFIFEGVLLGLMGAVVAIFLQWGVYELLRRAIMESDGAAILNLMNFKDLASSVVAIFCGSSLVIGVGGSLIAIRKFLQV